MPNEIQTQSSTQPIYKVDTTTDTSPSALIAMAISQDVDVDKLEKLMSLKERHDANEARKMFYLALTEFQSICPAIKKLKQGHNYQYAPLSDISAQIREPLLKAGLSYRFEQQHSESITVSCVVTHTDGHSEANTMAATPDTSGSKNGIQALGSTVTYLQRYTLIGALGITTADDDTDARIAQGCNSTISPEDSAIIQSKLVANGSEIPRFLNWVSLALKKKCGYYQRIDQIPESFLPQIKGKLGIV